MQELVLYSHRVGLGDYHQAWVTSTLPKSYLPSPQSRILETKTRASLSSVCIPSIPDSVPKRVTFSFLWEYMCITGQCGDGSLREVHAHAQLYLSEWFLLNFLLKLYVKSLLIKTLDLLQKEKKKKLEKDEASLLSSPGDSWLILWTTTSCFYFPLHLFLFFLFWNSLPRYVAQAGLLCRDWSCALSHPVVLFTDWETSHRLNVF